MTNNTSSEMIVWDLNGTIGFYDITVDLEFRIALTDNVTVIYH